MYRMKLHVALPNSMTVIPHSSYTNLIMSKLPAHVPGCPAISPPLPIAIIYVVVVKHMMFGLEGLIEVTTYEPRCEKTGLQGFRQGPTQTGLYNHRR